jgi:hypothetical protein
LRDVNTERASPTRKSWWRNAPGVRFAELLRELYVQRRWTDQEIAAHVSRPEASVSRATVRNWRGEFGISRAERAAVLEPIVEAPQ